MGELIQTDIFKDFEDCELEHYKKKVESLEKKVKHIEEMSHRVRRGNYAEIGRLKQDNVEIKERLNIIERNICNGTFKD